jgi:hypothetical protein
VFIFLFFNSNTNAAYRPRLHLATSVAGAIVALNSKPWIWLCLALAIRGFRFEVAPYSNPSMLPLHLLGLCFAVGNQGRVYERWLVEQLVSIKSALTCVHAWSFFWPGSQHNKKYRTTHCGILDKTFSSLVLQHQSPLGVGTL